MSTGINEFLPQLENRTVTKRILYNIEHYSKIIPHITRYDINGDEIRIVGLPSYKPKDYKWAYNKEEFKPEEVVKFTSKVENSDKKIFYTVYSEDIEKLALEPDLVAKTLAKQAQQVGMDAAVFLDEEIIKSFVCNLDNYKEGPAKLMIKKADIEKWKKEGTYTKRMAKLILTTARAMTVSSNKFNKKETDCKVPDLSRLMLFVDNGLYSEFEVEMTGPAVSMTLDHLEKKFKTVIPENLENNILFTINSVDSLGIAYSLDKRALVYDGYVNAHKILDHIWRKFFFIDFRPAFVCYTDGSVAREEG